MDKIMKNLIESEYKKLVSSDIIKLPKNYKINIATEYEHEHEHEHANNYILDIIIEKKKILSVKYELLGIYDKSCNLFEWASKMKLIDKISIKTTKNILKYKNKLKEHIINNTYSDMEYVERILYYLSNNIFFIEENNIQDLIKVCVFISKCQGIVKQDNNNVHKYYAVIDIIGT
jgi:CRISPR/Cas system-associated protein Cas5 (RAMP superfamily)